MRSFNGTEYDLFSNNCVSAALGTLNDTGIMPGAYYVPGTTPGRVYDVIKDGGALMKALGIILIVLLACGAIAAPPADREERAQTRCEIIDDTLSHVAAISVATPSDISEGHEHLYDVEFQSDGPLIRLPPQYYAPYWSDVTDITMEYPSRSANEGTLSLKIKGATGEYTQPIGKVQRACWKTIRSYIERKFPDHSPIVERVADR